MTLEADSPRKALFSRARNGLTRFVSVFIMPQGTSVAWKQSYESAEKFAASSNGRIRTPDVQETFEERCVKLLSRGYTLIEAPGYETSGLTQQLSAKTEAARREFETTLPRALDRLRKHPDRVEVLTGTPMSEAECAELERSLDIILAPTYRSFLQTYGMLQVRLLEDGEPLSNPATYVFGGPATIWLDGKLDVRGMQKAWLERLVDWFLPEDWAAFEAKWKPKQLLPFITYFQDDLNPLRLFDRFGRVVTARRNAFDLEDERVLETDFVDVIDASLASLERELGIEDEG